MVNDQLFDFEETNECFDLAVLQVYPENSRDRVVQLVLLRQKYLLVPDGCLVR